MRKIEVTDLTTGEKTVYDYSNNNWRNQYACMKNGAVHMWAPTELKNIPCVITSGRKYSSSRCR